MLRVWLWLSCILTLKEKQLSVPQSRLPFLKDLQVTVMAMTGQDLRQLLLNKWGHSYDIQIRRTQGRIFVLVMWKYLEQASFPLTESEYLAHLDTVATYLQAWGSVEQVQAYIEQTRDRPRLGKAVSIPLELGDRTSEWILEDF